MATESPFPILSEIASLDRMIGEHLGKMDKHQLRISSLEKKRQDIETATKENKQILQNKHLEAKRFELDLKKLEETKDRIKSHSDRATSEKEVDSLTKEMIFLTEEIAKLEKKTYDTMEEIDQLILDIKEAEVFLQGSLKSLAEITQEATKDIATEKEAIAILRERMQEKLSELTPEFKNAFEIVQKKFKNQTPLALIDQKGNCERCRFIIDRQSSVDVIRGLTPYFCPGCGRLLVVR